MKNAKILATCYAVNPYKGSEDAMGWNFVYQIARFRKVIAITRENNQAAIEKFMEEHPDPVYQNMTFLYFDLPKWARFWKKGSRGAMLYFYLWQRNVVNFIKKSAIEFDIAHNVNFHNDWTPTFLWKLGKPLVWGPVGHHPLIPRQYLTYYSPIQLIKDRLTWLVKNLFWKFSSSLKIGTYKAEHIWCMNSGVPKVLKLNNSQKAKFSVYPSVASEDFLVGEWQPKEHFNVISVGRFVPLKGFDLTIKAFHEFLKKIPERNHSQCQLTLVGSGPEKKRYEILIQHFGIENNVTIIEWIERKELMKLYEKSSVFLFPSHEGAGMVVAEALSFGLPVVCLDNEGPGEFITPDTGFAVKQAEYSQTISGLSLALLSLFLDKNLLYKMSKEARMLYEKKFSWDKRGEYLDSIFKNLEG